MATKDVIAKITINMSEHMEEQDILRLPQVNWYWGRIMMRKMNINQTS